MPTELKDTLNLPQTEFPMRANLVTREPTRVEHWTKGRLYQRIQERNAGGPAFVLHDGPPFTNNDVHIGTALNKALKDITLRHRSMKGFRTPYVPGWDCHGLPIEQRVVREIQEKKETVSTAELRARCDTFSELWIEKQTAQFKRLGVVGDWENPYRTKAPAFEADILRTFAAFIESGLVYRSKKPVYWSIPFETALAEAEIEYKEHTSIAIWVKFKAIGAKADSLGFPMENLSVVIWTTTPWTIPANLAIAVHPQLDYVCVESGGSHYIVAAALLEQFTKDCALESHTVVKNVRGSDLEGLETRHPFIDRASPVVLADYVTTESGTGCVHTAPGHGLDDYNTGLKYGLEIYCPVGDDGRYLDDGRIPAELVGLSTLETVEALAKKQTSTANVGVLKLLAANGALLAKRKYEHSYPHCWRSKTPIVFRAVDQWFVSLDKDGLRQRALDAVAKVKWVPAWGENRMRGGLEVRPDWCISRQRAWGVPIPAFFDSTRKAYIDGSVARAVADRVEKVGSNCWYESSAAQLLDGITLPQGWPAASELTPGADTLDVWIDSGSSHAAVLARGMGGSEWPADLYLEGSDQHRGWFQSSLWTSMIAKGAAPYRQVLTHGFIVDQDRNKISKSSAYEKPQTLDAYVARHGADVIRLWISSQDFRDDFPVSEEIFGHVGETYRLLRNTLRFQISNLFDFDAVSDAVPFSAMNAIDRWALNRTATLIAQCDAAYESFEFHRVYQLCNQFCSVTLSSTYHDVLKDRLYTFARTSRGRRSAQTALHHIFSALSRVLAPILVFTADEAWSFGTGDSEFVDDPVHLQSWPEIPAEWLEPVNAAAVDAVVSLRAPVNERLEVLRKSGAIGKGLDASVAFTGDPSGIEMRALGALTDSLAEMFIVSQVTVTPATGAPFAIEAKTCETMGLVRCPRCWRWVEKLSSTETGETCPRCVEALQLANN
jgi:isoleucyl-tRNA synthetase